MLCTGAQSPRSTDAPWCGPTDLLRTWRVRIVEVGQVGGCETDRIVTGHSPRPRWRHSVVSEIVDFTESVRSLANGCTCDAHVLMPGPKQKAQACSPALSASGRGDA